VAVLLSPSRTARLFTDLDDQQCDLLGELAAAGPDPVEDPSVLLPHCPSCRRRPRQIILKGDGTRVDFIGCGHAFTLTREALLAGLAAQRSD